MAAPALAQLQRVVHLALPRPYHRQLLALSWQQRPKHVKAVACASRPRQCLLCARNARMLPSLQVSTSKERSFACVDFVDTPGLVDGDMKVTDPNPGCLRRCAAALLRGAVGGGEQGLLACQWSCSAASQKASNAPPVSLPCSAAPLVNLAVDPLCQPLVNPLSSRARVQYPFPVKDSILWMAGHVDMILVFFDPIVRCVQHMLCAGCAHGST